MLHAASPFDIYACYKVATDFIIFFAELISPDDLLQACTLWEKFDVYEQFFRKIHTIYILYVKLNWNYIYYLKKKKLELYCNL